DLQYWIAGQGPGDLTTSPHGPSVTTGGKTVDTRVVKRVPPFTTILVHGAESLRLEETNATTEANMGRLERIIDAEAIASETDLQTVADAAFTEEEDNRAALTATILDTDSSIPGIDYTEGNIIWWQFPGTQTKTAKTVQRISWTHGTSATYQVQASQILTPEAGLAAAVDKLLAEFQRRRSATRAQRRPSTPEQVITTQGASTGAYIHLVKDANQSIAAGTGTDITWTALHSAITPPENFTTPSLPGAAITISQPGYYDISVRLTWDTFLGGGDVTITRERGGSKVTVWPPAEHPGLWDSGDGSNFAGLAPAIPCLPGDIIRVNIAHADASAQDLAMGSLAVYLVDRINNPTGFIYSEVVLADGPIAYWPLNEGAGTTASDVTGNGHNGTYTNSPGLGQTGIMLDGTGATSVDFEGSEHVLGADWATLDFAGTTAYTLEAWIETDTVASGSAIIIQKQVSSSGVGWELIRNTATLHCNRIGASGSQSVNSGTISTATRYHVAATFDGTTLRLYLNAVEVDSDGTTQSQDANTVAVSIARDSADSSSNFNGRIDEVAVYDRALTPAEILEHYIVGNQAS
ncbi:MAG: LamG domain-containing protein, partial [Actinobacteria bacterium]|nr:LamG domain-containing protein [Actinomycetota bacterium]